MDIDKPTSLDRDMVIKFLMDMASESNGIMVSSKNAARMATQLKNFAELIERSPESVASLVFVGTEKVRGDKTGVSTCVAVAGSTSSIAASYLLFEEAGKAAMSEMIPLIMRLISELDDDSED